MAKAPAPPQPPAGSQCASCSRFDEGRCFWLAQIAEAVKEPLPFIAHNCPEYDELPKESE